MTFCEDTTETRLPATRAARFRGDILECGRQEIDRPPLFLWIGHPRGIYGRRGAFPNDAIIQISVTASLTMQHACGVVVPVDPSVRPGSGRGYGVSRRSKIYSIVWPASYLLSTMVSDRRALRGQCRRLRGLTSTPALPQACVSSILGICRTRLDLALRLAAACREMLREPWISRDDQVSSLL